MKKLLSIFICILSQGAFAQFAIVVDKDGYTNVRKSPSIGDNIVGKVLNGDIVYCFEPEKDWLPIDYNLGQENSSGYIHKSRVKFIKSLEKIASKKLTDSSIVFKNESINISVTEVKFNSKNYKLQYHNGNSTITEGNYLEKINGKKYWGTDGNVPKRQYGQCVLQIGKDKIYLPVDNLFEPSLASTAVNIDKATKRIYITTSNGDASGAYVVIWVIENGKFKQRFIVVPF